MKKQLTQEFDLAKFQSNEYNVVTRNGNPVSIAGVINEKHGSVILGKCQGAVAQWDEQGRYFGTNYNTNLDLLIYAKPKVMYVNVIKSKGGAITARVTEYRAYIQKGNELIAQYQLEVGE